MSSRYSDISPRRHAKRSSLTSDALAIPQAAASYLAAAGRLPETSLIEARRRHPAQEAADQLGDDPLRRRYAMLALTDRQLALVFEAATPLDPVKRSVLLERLAASLRYRCGPPSDSDVQAPLKSALRGLKQERAA